MGVAYEKVSQEKTVLHKGGRWFQNNLTPVDIRDRLSPCQDNQDLIRPAPCIMLWIRKLLDEKLEWV